MIKIILILSLLFFPVPSLYAEIGSGSKAFEHGLALKEQGALLEAEVAFLEALRFEPANGDYHFELANVYAARYDRMRKKDDPKGAELMNRAERALEQAVMYRPDFLIAHYNLGIIYKQQGLFEDARESFRRVLKLDPNQVQAQIQIGATYEEQGFFDEARDEYLKARDMNVSDREIPSLLADLDEHEQWAAQRAKAQGSGASSVGAPKNYPAGRDNSAGYFQDSPNNAQGTNQALPYLASMLAQQFMSRVTHRGESDDEE